jgi:hypothetical protein
MSGKWLNRAILDTSHNPPFATLALKRAKRAAVSHERSLAIPVVALRPPKPLARGGRLSDAGLTLAEGATDSQG